MVSLSRSHEILHATSRVVVFKKPSLLCGVIKLEVVQNLILNHVTIVSTNKNVGNSQILRDIMRFVKNIPFKEQHCLQTALLK